MDFSAAAAPKAQTNKQASTRVLVARGIDKRVRSGEGELVILRDIDLEVTRGEALAVVGASGSGKSTLLALLAGLDTPSAGSVQIDGVDLFTLDEDRRAELRGRLLGFVFQSSQLLPALSALENVMLPLELADAQDAEPRARKMLARVGLGERLGHYPKHLSGGEQQRVALARAFVVRPKLLLADEPTGSLDAQSGAAVIELLFELNREQGTTLVLVTHDEALAARCARAVRLVGGRLACTPPGASRRATCAPASCASWRSRWRSQWRASPASASSAIASARRWRAMRTSSWAPISCSSPTIRGRRQSPIACAPPARVPRR